MKERKKNNPEVRCLTAGFFFHRIFLMSPDVAVSPRFRPRLWAFKEGAVTHTWGMEG